MKIIFSEIKFEAEFIRDHTLQPQWYKVLKVFLLIGFLLGYSLLFGIRKTLLFGAVFFGLSLVLHLIYRVKTQKYTRSWMDFIVYQQEGERRYQRIGGFYYLAIAIFLGIAILLSQLLISR